MRLSAMKAETGEFKTLEGGHKLRLPVRPAELPPLNKPCTLAIRPEHVVISRENGSGENVLPAMVREIQFAGATSSVRIDANGLLVEALLIRSDNFSVGDACMVVMPPDRITLLKE